MVRVQRPHGQYAGEAEIETKCQPNKIHKLTGRVTAACGDRAAGRVGGGEKKLMVFDVEEVVEG